MLKKSKSAVKGNSANRRKRTFRAFIAVVIIAVIAGLGTVWYIRHVYEHNLNPVSTSTKISYFTVTTGTSAHQIAVNLQSDGLVRSSAAFEWYVRTNELHDSLQAGTYSLEPDMSVPTIVHKMITGDVAKNLLTIIPGQRLDQVEQTFVKSGYTQSQVDAAFSANQYRDLPALASLPQGASLEGYLYPDSFQKLTDTPADLIIRDSLSELSTKLTPDLVSAYQTEGLSVNQAIILASIVEQESGDPSTAPTVAQVFLKRISIGMMLGSDPTAFYGAILAGQPASVNYDSPYNTRLHTGLPPGPIGTVSKTALNAVAHPSATDYLYFITGDDGTMHFTHTEAEHEAAIAQYCIKKCGN